MAADTIPQWEGIWNFSSASLPEEGLTSVEVKDIWELSPYIVTLSVGQGATLVSGTTDKTIDDSGTWASLDQLNANIGGDSVLTQINLTEGSYVGASSGSLTLTISGLQVGSKYNVSLISGLNDPNQGSWNEIKMTNEYDSIIATNLGGNSLLVPKNSHGGYAFEGVTVGQDGRIAVEVYRASNHQAVLNGLGLALVPSVPEPTTGALSLLALAGLCIRRRK